ncbi:MAG: ribosome maturation factor RimP [Gammaproteobacteria bacterium]|nr:ribosome maturation factor RimP [Gammaproteobacteria bacterium]
MIQQEIEHLVRPSIEDMGIELWGVEYQRQGHSGLLRIYIDKSEGVVVNDCERVSRQVSALLDVNDPIPGQYQLEISSPGMPRPLFYPEQYARYLGDEVQIRLNVPMDGRRNIVGLIKAVEDDALVLSEEDIEHTFLFSNIIKAHLTRERGEA